MPYPFDRRDEQESLHYHLPNFLLDDDRSSNSPPKRKAFNAYGSDPSMYWSRQQTPPPNTRELFNQNAPTPTRTPRVNQPNNFINNHYNSSESFMHSGTNAYPEQDHFSRFFEPAIHNESPRRPQNEYDFDIASNSPPRSQDSFRSPKRQQFSSPYHNQPPVLDDIYNRVAQFGVGTTVSLSNEAPQNRPRLSSEPTPHRHDSFRNDNSTWKNPQSFNNNRGKKPSTKSGNRRNNVYQDDNRKKRPQKGRGKGKNNMNGRRSFPKRRTHSERKRRDGFPYYHSYQDNEQRYVQTVVTPSTSNSRSELEPSEVDFFEENTSVRSRNQSSPSPTPSSTGRSSTTSAQARKIPQCSTIVEEQLEKDRIVPEAQQRKAPHSEPILPSKQSRKDKKQKQGKNKQAKEHERSTSVSSDKHTKRKKKGGSDDKHSKDRNKTDDGHQSSTHDAQSSHHKKKSRKHGASKGRKHGKRHKHSEYQKRDEHHHPRSNSTATNNNNDSGGTGAPVNNREDRTYSDLTPLKKHNSNTNADNRKKWRFTESDNVGLFSDLVDDSSDDNKEVDSHPTTTKPTPASTKKQRGGIPEDTTFPSTNGNNNNNQNNNNNHNNHHHHYHRKSRHSEKPKRPRHGSGHENNDDIFNSLKPTSVAPPKPNRTLKTLRHRFLFTVRSLWSLFGLLWTLSWVILGWLYQVLTKLLRFFYEMHKHAFHALGDHHLLFRFAFLYGFPKLTEEMLFFAPPWSPHIIWCLFVGHISVLFGLFVFLEPFQVFSSTANGTLIQQLNPSERLAIAFLLCASGSENRRKPTLILVTIFLFFISIFFGEYLLTQWFVLLVATFNIERSANGKDSTIRKFKQPTLIREEVYNFWSKQQCDSFVDLDRLQRKSSKNSDRNTMFGNVEY